MIASVASIFLDMCMCINDELYVRYVECSMVDEVEEFFFLLSLFFVSSTRVTVLLLLVRCLFFFFALLVQKCLNRIYSTRADLWSYVLKAHILTVFFPTCC